MPYARRVTPEQNQRMVERLRLAFDLYDLSERMLRQKLRRKHPEATESEIDAKIGEWLQHRPGAEHGDAEGQPITWPRRRA